MDRDINSYCEAIIIAKNQIILWKLGPPIDSIKLCHMSFKPPKIFKNLMANHLLSFSLYFLPPFSRLVRFTIIAILKVEKLLYTHLHTQ